MNFPAAIEKYLEENKISKSDLYFLVTTTDGLVTDLGNSKEIIISAPVVGEMVNEFMPVFEGLFPRKSNLYLPNIQLYQEQYFNIYLIIAEEKVWILLIQPVSNENFNQNNIVQLARENTLAYVQLQKTKEQLQELVKLKDQFVNIVSHDLSSSISTLTDGISFLLDDLNASKPFDNSHREIIVQIREELVRLLNYNDKLYNWTKLNLDSIELNFSNVSLDLMLASLNGQFDRRLNEKHIKMVLSICHHVEIHTDYVLFNQAISNLIDNAIKFSSENSVIKIVVEEHSIKIIDKGQGMSKETIEQILKGESLKSTKGTSGEVGTGLGLSIVTKILKTLNYKLEIKSENGVGTTFIISF